MVVDKLKCVNIFMPLSLDFIFDYHLGLLCNGYTIDMLDIELILLRYLLFFFLLSRSR